MNVDFPFILVVLTFGSGFIWFVYHLFFLKRRQARLAEGETLRLPTLVEYSKSLFPVFLIVLVIRSFIIQPYRVPTGSLEPTVLPNDFIAVSQFSYGLRWPVLNSKFFGVGEPKRGEIAVFRYPPEPSMIFVKRVIGVPGDHVEYKNKVLTINGQVAKQTDMGEGVDHDGHRSALVKQEDLLGVEHSILVQAAGGFTEDYDITVPEGMYFMMGDNRDGSSDSRFWGFVPEENLIGKALMIWFSWDGDARGVRWDRLGNILYPQTT